MKFEDEEIRKVILSVWEKIVEKYGEEMEFNDLIKSERGLYSDRIVLFSESPVRMRLVF